MWREGVADCSLHLQDTRGTQRMAYNGGQGLGVYYPFSWPYHPAPSITAPANLASEEVPNRKALGCDGRGRSQKHLCFASTEVKRSLCEDCVLPLYSREQAQGLLTVPSSPRSPPHRASPGPSRWHPRCLGEMSGQLRSGSQKRHHGSVANRLLGEE